MGFDNVMSRPAFRISEWVFHAKYCIRILSFSFKIRRLWQLSVMRGINVVALEERSIANSRNWRMANRRGIQETVLLNCRGAPRRKLYMPSEISTGRSDVHNIQHFLSSRISQSESHVLLTLFFISHVSRNHG